MSEGNAVNRNLAAQPTEREGLRGGDQGAKSAQSRLQGDALGSMADSASGRGSLTVTAGKQIFDRERGDSKISSLPSLEIARGPDANGKAREISSRGHNKEVSFTLETQPIAKPLDAHGHVPVNRFDQVPVKRVSVHDNGKISLELHQKTTVRQPNDPKEPNRRNQELKLGEKGPDGTIQCSANVTTRKGPDGQVNHITLDKPTNLKVAGEEFIGKTVFGQRIGTWQRGESAVQQAVLDNTKGTPEARITFNHPLYGKTTTSKAIPQEDFAQMASWINSARNQALSGTNVAEINPKANPLFARD